MRSSARFAVASIVAFAAVSCAPQSAAVDSASSPDPAPSQQYASAPGTVYGGVYTAAQADRGENLANARCGACHSPESEWSAGRLLLSYNGRPVWELVSQIRATMPMDAPGSLSLQEYTDIVSYILELNAIPTGDVELAGDQERLSQIEIEYRR